MKLDYTLVQGKFIKRINRFTADVDIDGVVHTVHVPNTGRLGELFVEGAKVFLSFHDDDKRKTKYDIRFVIKDELLLSVDSQLPNKVFEEALMNGFFKVFGEVKSYKREMKYKNSRFDFYIESDRKIYVEVKGVTLCEEGRGKFPDAPTTRGEKHVKELVELTEQGFDCYVVFIAQHPGISSFSPNEGDESFTETIKSAYDKGVKVLCFKTDNSLNEVKIVKEIPVVL